MLYPTYSQLLSLVVGTVIGVLFGYSFFYRTISLEKKQPKYVLRFVFFSFFRIALIGIFWTVLVQKTTLSISMVLIAFLISFWATLLKKKVLPYGKS